MKLRANLNVNGWKKTGCFCKLCKKIRMEQSGTIGGKKERKSWNGA